MSCKPLRGAGSDMDLSLGNLGRRLGRVVWMVPGIVALQHVGPNGVQTAEGCVGGQPGSGWDDLRVADAENLTRVPIATDGFVLLEGQFRYDGFDPELADVWIQATDESGAEVPGQLRLLRADANARYDIT